MGSCKGRANIQKKKQEKRCFAQLEKDDWQQLVASAGAKSTHQNTKITGKDKRIF